MSVFGSLARRLRRESGMTLEQVASAIGVSIAYVSDVERGKRAAFAADRLVAFASAVGADVKDLRVAAAESRGAFELDPEVSRKHREVGAMLMRASPHLSDEDLARIALIMQASMIGFSS